MCACNCNVNVCHVFDCSSVFFFYCKCKKNWRMIFYNFLTSWHTYWQFIWMQNKVQDKCAHLHVLIDDRWGIMVCSSVFQGTQSAYLDIWTPLDNFSFVQDGLLSLSLCLSLCLSLSLSLSLSLPVCLSVCLTVCLSLSVSHSLTQTLSQSLSLSLSLSLPLTCPVSLFKNWHLSACSQKHLSELLFQNSKAAPSSSRSRVEVVVVVGLPYVMSFMSTRRSAKPVKKRLGSIQEELQKSFPTADTLDLPEKTPDHLEPENAAQKRHSEEKIHDELQRSVKTPSICRGKLLSAHQGGAGRRCYGATCLTWNRSIPMSRVTARKRDTNDIVLRGDRSKCMSVCNVRLRWSKSGIL